MVHWCRGQGSPSVRSFLLSASPALRGLPGSSVSSPGSLPLSYVLYSIYAYSL
nr:MAG TPA: hypothetical protein [Caudoviricetes sp.]